ncbi:hypothetical protein Cgig2_015911 [Carnegiea gigantea]|uniref:Uncharacterized protein n=1 Tax=Carnegiea gigantea TaxID=171969 RepID=A0A9Q1GMU1_9CARY|nr:hypothetical protein Cgig2_015911 [Carnegiea gigantea]
MREHGKPCGQPRKSNNGDRPPSICCSYTTKGDQRTCPVAHHLQHFMLIIKPSTTPSQALVFDFQPRDPEDIYVALSALRGKSVPGITRVRKISGLPRSRCWFIDSTKPNAVEAAYEFNSNWKTDLRIGYHDCRHYTNGLAEVLTGKKNVLEHLRTRDILIQRNQ